MKRTCVKKLVFTGITIMIAAVMNLGCKQNTDENIKSEKFTIKFKPIDGLGSITAAVDNKPVSSPAKVEKGKTINFTAVNNGGLKVKRWIGTDDAEGNISNHAKLKVKENAEVSVEFIKPEYKSFTVNKVTFKMLRIESVAKAELGAKRIVDNSPRTITLSSYMIGENEVTQELYETVIGINPSFFNGIDDNKEPCEGEQQNKRPVENVNWYAAVLFCNELTKKINSNSQTQCVYYSDAGFKTVYTRENANNKDLPYMDISKQGFRLPTEAEWEWACMGGENHKYAGTNDEDSLEDYAWFTNPAAFTPDPAKYRTHQTGLKKPNGYKLYDMSGNVNEWCWDWYAKTLASDETDPVGADSGTYRIIRGGGFFNTPDECEAAYRSNRKPETEELKVGFRLVCRS